MSSFTYVPDKCAHYIAMPLAEREALRAAMVEKYGSIKAFVTAHAFVGANSVMIHVLNGRNRICPKKLAKIKTVLGLG